MAEERLAGEPDHDIRILAEGPEHAHAVEFVKGFTQNVDTLRFQRVEMIHRAGYSVQNPSGARFLGVIWLLVKSAKGVRERFAQFGRPFASLKESLVSLLRFSGIVFPAQDSPPEK